ncbi:hypothetical protein GCM10022243_36780 [Saccharothrix violaceirubra]
MTGPRGTTVPAAGPVTSTEMLVPPGRLPSTANAGVPPASTAAAVANPRSLGLNALTSFRVVYSREGIECERVWLLVCSGEWR